ncbi:tRNA-specific 2-thiouridylase MnmA [Rubripirellula tenax]|uniref:tRNA-specific 2-thiouridylase MnmA n=1 Tax=Rubripirellula tenax TaxID=2528015 RepID=A0A5C6EST6_9BACT|nr:ATP-dependent sacrificial sulfur transferase LarE [Rubripirellula tenax]TWU50519.1 tRNA-specific 2-thiouridylase MnmA [Rubripirellula tenax]
MPSEPKDAAVADKATRLIDRLSQFAHVAVAFSGGVDSSVVAAAALRARANAAIAVTARSPSLAKSQAEIAVRVAGEMGIAHRFVETDEINNGDYRRNDGRRCFFCKQTLYRTMAAIAAHHPSSVIVSGTNADDLDDYRPGLKAAEEASVVAPLAELGLNKRDVRQLAVYFGLSNHDLAAAPCLASRVAYGVEVTTERLSRIERAEAWLADRKFVHFRVRLHEGELARIEVTKDRIADLVALDMDGALTDAFVSFGFKYVTIDTRGFRSGSLNEVLTPQSISLYSIGETAS